MPTRPQPPQPPPTQATKAWMAKPDPDPASAANDATVTWQERRIAELEQAVKERDAMIRILRDRLAGR